MQRHDEEKRIVVISVEDLKNVEDFFTHFKLPMPDLLTHVINKIKSNPKEITFEDQDMFRAAISFAITTVDHPLVRDAAFANIRTKCEKAWFDAQFNMDIESILSGKDLSK